MYLSISFFLLSTTILYEYLLNAWQLLNTAFHSVKFFNKLHSSRKQKKNVIQTYKYSCCTWSQHIANIPYNFCEFTQTLIVWSANWAVYRFHNNFLSNEYVSLKSKFQLDGRFYGLYCFSPGKQFNFKMVDYFWLIIDESY